MLKIFGLLMFIVVSFSVQAQECANDVNSLKLLVGNSDLPLEWKETSGRNPLMLTLSDGQGSLSLRLRTSFGDWANVSGVICRNGDGYVARVRRIVWGPVSPRMARLSRISSIWLSLPYQSLLTVSVAVFNFEFSPVVK